MNKRKTVASVQSSDGNVSVSELFKKSLTVEATWDDKVWIYVCA